MSRPVVRFRPSKLAAPTTMGSANVELFGGHLDGLRMDNVQLAGTWPEIVTMERYNALLSDLRKMAADGANFTFIKRFYGLCRCAGAAPVAETGRVRYCLGDCPS